MKSKGAPDTCFAVSEDDDLDGNELSLADTPQTKREIGNFLSCIPGKLAYLEDQEERWILERQAKP